MFWIILGDGRDDYSLVERSVSTVFAEVMLSSMAVEDRMRWSSGNVSAITLETSQGIDSMKKTPCHCPKS
jgi:hypothetical protein